MTVIDSSDTPQQGDAPQGHATEGGHHETPAQRHQKEHMATWMFIGGDAVFFALEIFFWFYLRSLNTTGMWIGAKCSKLNPCTDGLGNPITHPIPKAAIGYTLGVAALIIVSAAFIWFAEIQGRDGASRKALTPLLGLGVLFSLAAIGLQFYQFQVLPFTTIDGTYASVFTFFMGSNIAHFLLVATIGTGLMNRARIGKYDNHNWYQIHSGRLFAVWVAFSCAVLAVIASFFA